MPTISVWAPNSGQIHIQTPSGKQPMAQQDGGWWSCEVAIRHGEDYGFWLDNQGPYPDPRSRWQANGAHGLSRYFAPDFQWQDSHWQGTSAETMCIYELHVGTFSETGDFQGVIEHLDYLVSLGVSHLQLLPIAEFSGARGWGYDGVHLFAAYHKYGGPEALMALVNACHSKGLGVILDVVYNHLGPSGNYLGHFGPYFHDNYNTPWGQAVNLDSFDSQEVRRYFIDNALMWLRDFHFDGLRLDAIHTLLDGSALHFLEELASEVRALEAKVQRPLTLIAESHMNDPRVMRSPKDGGYGFNAQWHDDFHHAVIASMTQEKAGYFQDYGCLTDIAKVFNEGVFFDGQYCQYRRRSLGRPATGLHGQHFIAFIQNHDQVGNRPGGQRLADLLEPGQVKIAAALLLLSPFVPMLFQGEERGARSPFLFFTDHQEKPLGTAVNKGRQREALEFGWTLDKHRNPQSDKSFMASKLDWHQCDHDILNWYQQLLTLRANHSDLQAGAFLSGRAQVDSAKRTFKITRGAFDILCNFSEDMVDVDVGEQNGTILLSSDKGIAQQHGVLHLPKWSVTIIGPTTITQP